MDNKPTKSFDQFQEFVWLNLPARRTTAGREVVDDLVALAIQEWPSDFLSQVDPGTREEAIILKQLVKDIRRQVHILYGDSRFTVLWIAVLQFIIPIIVQIILEWWREKKSHRGKITIWRRKYGIKDRNDGPERKD
tara:strand:- start:508 stop:915 length:408 start_codon:yes stop_codon:yes gene_type:complete